MDRDAKQRILEQEAALQAQQDDEWQRYDRVVRARFAKCCEEFRISHRCVKLNSIQPAGDTTDKLTCDLHAHLLQVLKQVQRTATSSNAARPPLYLSCTTASSTTETAASRAVGKQAMSSCNNI
jgi:hypothetical protein